MTIVTTFMPYPTLFTLEREDFTQNLGCAVIPKFVTHMKRKYFLYVYVYIVFTYHHM